MIDIAEVDPAPTADQLTKEDIAALRTADSVSFHHYDGQSVIRAEVRGRGEPAIFTASQQRLFPKTSSFDPHRTREVTCLAKFCIYEDHHNVVADPSHLECFVHYVAADVWRTVAGLLRKGDAITLMWVAGNDHQYLTDAGLHMDELYLKSGDRIYLLTTSAYPDNTARMIRRH